MSINLGGWLKGLGSAAVHVAETVPGIGTVVKVGEDITSHLHPGTSANAPAVQGTNMVPAIMAGAGLASVVGGTALAVHEYRKHRRPGMRAPVRHRRRHTGRATRRAYQPYRQRHRKKGNKMPAALKRYWKTHKRGRKAA